LVEICYERFDELFSVLLSKSGRLAGMLLQPALVTYSRRLHIQTGSVAGRRPCNGGRTMAPLPLSIVLNTASRSR
jgi:hypothetical protein